MGGTNWQFGLPDWGQHLKTTWAFGLPDWDSPQTSEGFEFTFIGIVIAIEITTEGVFVILI